MITLQATALRAMMVKEHWEVLRSLVTSESIDDTTGRQLLNIINRLQEESASDITVEQMRMDIEASYKLKLDVQEELFCALVEVGAAQVQDVQLLKSTIKRFITRDKSLRAAQYIGSHIDDDGYDPSMPFHMLEDAVNSSVVLDAEVEDYATAGSPSEPTRTGVTRLGCSRALDEKLDGGTAAGELTIYVAPAGVGKTSFLWNSVAKAAESGRNVLGITLEINSRKCVQRIDQSLTGMDKFELISAPFVALEKREQLTGKIWIKDWCARQPTVDDIRALVLQMRQRGQAVDYLMIDYMELVRPEFYNIRNPRFNYSQVAKALRALAAELSIPVVTAWQTNRGGADKHILNKTDIGEDWGVIKIADIAIGLNQNVEELREKTMRVNILKQRESTNRDIVTLYCDLDRMKILDIADYREEEVVSYGTEGSTESTEGQ